MNKSDGNVIFYGPEDEEINVTHRYQIYYDPSSETSDVELVDSFDIEEAYVYREIPDEEDIAKKEEIMKKISFPIQHIHLGAVEKDSKITLEYPYEGDPSVIKRIKAGCQCTVDLVIDEEKQVLTGTFDTKNMKGQFDKYINVFFNDGSNIRVKNSLGVYIEDPSATKIRLTFNGIIK